MWPLQKKCKTSRDRNNIYYELILDINDNPLVRRFWCKSRLRKHKSWAPDANRWAAHHLEITIKYSKGGTEVTENYDKYEEGNEVEWGKTISGGMSGPGGPEEIRPLSMTVVGQATRDGKDYNLKCHND